MSVTSYDFTVPRGDLSQPWFCLWFVTCYLFVLVRLLFFSFALVYI